MDTKYQRRYLKQLAVLQDYIAKEQGSFQRLASQGELLKPSRSLVAAMRDATEASHALETAVDIADA